MRLLNRTAGRLSRHRRNPLAGLLVLVLGLLLSGGLYAVMAPAQAEESKSQEQLVQEGRELFIAGCSYCHGENGQGVPTLDGRQVGPSLVGVGEAAVDFQVGTGRMPMTQPGQQAPRKERIYDAEETKALAAYVASLGPGPAIPDKQDYDLETSLQSMPEDEREAAREEAVARGGEIFLSNCTACHNYQGSGGAMPRGGHAPSLKGVDRKHMYEAMLTGPQAMPNFSNGNLSPEEKREVIAYLKSLEDSPKYGGFGMGGLGPVSDGVYAWIVGIGILVGFTVWIAAHTTRSSRKKVTE